MTSEGPGETGVAAKVPQTSAKVIGTTGVASELSRELEEPEPAVGGSHLVVTADPGKENPVLNADLEPDSAP